MQTSSITKYQFYYSNHISVTKFTNNVVDFLLDKTSTREGNALEVENSADLIK